MLALEDEIADDPLGRGYSTMSAQQVADDLNTQYRSKNKVIMTGTEISDVITKAAYSALTEEKKDRLLLFVNKGDADPFGFGETVMLDIFGSGSDTITALAAARVVLVTRAKELALPEIKAGWIEEIRR